MSDVVLKFGEQVTLKPENNLKLKIVKQNVVLKFFNSVTINNTFSPVSLSVVDGTTYLIPAGKLLLSIAVVPASGDRILSAGYASGATQILDSEEITSNDSMNFVIGRRFHVQTTIHFSDYIGDLILYIL
jgi:hypothetical protein